MKKEWYISCSVHKEWNLLKRYIKSELLELLKTIRFTLLRIYYVHIRWRWHKLWIRKNEFHHSLNTDIDIMVLLSSNEGRIQVL